MDATGNPPDAPSGVKPSAYITPWSLLLLVAAAGAALCLLLQRLAPASGFSPLLDAAWLMGVVMFSALLFVAARHSLFVVLIAAVVLGAVFLSGVSYAAGLSRDRFAFMWIVFEGGFLLIAAPVLSVLAWSATRHPLRRRAFRLALTASAAVLTGAAAPGVWTAFGEPPFVTLLGHDPAAAGKLFFYAVTNYPGTRLDHYPSAPENDLVRWAIRNEALDALPPAIQIEYAHREDGVGEAARWAIWESGRSKPDSAVAPLLAEIERQGGPAASPKVWWLFTAAAEVKKDDRRLILALLDRLAHVYIREESSPLERSHPGEEGILTDRLVKAQFDKDMVALRLEAIMETRPEKARSISSEIGELRSAAVNERLGARWASDEVFDSVYTTTPRQNLHYIAADSRPLREKLLARMRADRGAPADAWTALARVQQEWTAMQTYATPPEVADSVAAYLSGEQGGSADDRVRLLGEILRGKHPEARSIASRALPGLLKIEGDGLFFDAIFNLRYNGFTADPRLIAGAFEHYGHGSSQQSACSKDRKYYFEWVFGPGALRAWRTSKQDWPVVEKASEVMARDEACLDWLTELMGQEGLVWPALRDRAIAALFQESAADADRREGALRYLKAIAREDEAARKAAEGR